VCHTAQRATVDQARGRRAEPLVQPVEPVAAQADLLDGREHEREDELERQCPGIEQHVQGPVERPVGDAKHQGRAGHDDVEHRPEREDDQPPTRRDPSHVDQTATQLADPLSAAGQPRQHDPGEQRARAATRNTPPTP
jgi:hypothetical protein